MVEPAPFFILTEGIQHVKGSSALLFDLRRTSANIGDPPDVQALRSGELGRPLNLIPSWILDVLEDGRPHFTV